MLEYSGSTVGHESTLRAHYTRCKRYRLTIETHMLTPVTSAGH